MQKGKYVMKLEQLGRFIDDGRSVPSRSFMEGHDEQHDE